ncbi:CAP domain-containing protein [Streptomyces sp. NPDC006482]|uniref:CAP domain-containing protein n=1 Tax=Streptomyces sp. NPDC006482 TaxID=3154306 RepID=UPI0033A3F6A9
MGTQHGTELVKAAQRGEPLALDRLIAVHLPLVYNIVGRAMNGHHDVDDVVRETMLRTLGGLGGLRSPDGFRSWLVALTMNSVRSHENRRRAASPTGSLDDSRDLARPGTDFVDLTVVRLNLSGQCRETAEATRWMEPDDRDLLSLWWLECAGELTRHEVAAALQLPAEHTAARVERMKARLDAARVTVRALSENPLCPALRYEIGTWDGRPSALWRERIAWHARACPHCAALSSGLVPAERLLAGLLLVPPAGLLLASVRERAGVELAAAPLTSPRHGPRSASQPGGRSAGPGATRGDRRRQRRQQRGRRRAVVAAGIAVVAVTGGAFSLIPGAQENNEALETSHTAALGGAVPPSPEPTTAPASTPASTPVPAGSAPSASQSPRKTASPAPSRTTPSAPRTRSLAPSRPTPTPVGTRTPTRPSPSTSTGDASGADSTAQQVIDLVNSARAEEGCGPLTGNAQLHQAAQGHSEDMAARDFFDHTDPDGDGPGERITAAGYAWSTYGENIAMGQQTPEQVMDSWMNSPGHRANILNCSFKEIGIGLYTSGGPYWTQAFGAR